ncbi:hypothetical protein [Vibrio anguillarum]|uniref:hypothetical protein n=1 Tax=Vibrio anguillarum TaxID=55601 RepID=UPI00188BA373|nr:hypothetical protein [Vibrio anguillarum]MBF4337581.1 hypothetical protein [Vibrio anguillarum]
MPKQYPLEINNVGGDTYIVMSKGHHDIHEFMQKVREDGYEWPLGMPKHVWIKATPDRSGESICVYHVVKEGTRGAFPATYSWESCGDDLYHSGNNNEH